jgi:hypothetical protein
MNEQEIQPWVVIVESAGDRTLALWQLSETEQPALALFSSAVQAQKYAAEHSGNDWQVNQPERSALLAIMIQCFQQQIELAVLDPDGATAKRIFKLRDVLRAARDEMR